MITRKVLSLGTIICFLIQTSQLSQAVEENLYFDSNLPEYETFLTPADFAAYSEESDDRSNSPHPDLWDSDAMYSTDKFEGDIANDLNASSVSMFIQGGPIGSQNEDRQLNAIRDRRQLWKDGRIPYAISSQYSSYSRSVIASSMNEYTTKTCIKWVPKTNEKDYVYLLPDRGCYSMVGRTGGRQVLSLGNGCIQRGIIIHEMLHATGFFHEQSRSDRDDYVNILYNNIQRGMETQFEKYSPVTIQNLGTTYDYDSIMHYGPKAFSRNGLPTIVPKKTNARIGQRSGFSQTDVYKINTLYECPGSKPDATGPPQPSVVAPSVPLTTVNPLTSATEIASTASQLIVKPSTISPIPAENCTNLRPDCEQLALTGWCNRNKQWMAQNCPVSCNLCVPTTPNTGVPTNGVCEDLRVDCADLVTRRYCITAQTFSSTYCRRSCGYCYAPITESPTDSRTVSVVHTTTSATLPTRQSLITFWPLVRPDDISTTLPPPSTTSSLECKDKAQYCPHWSKAGYCSGIFANFMRSNCERSCHLCSALT
ncbi:Metalloendopeptidase [Aphelenchoides besseyi]|nr:Metalloendopeptidase [Aphelenchoides besseyi]KAI6201040.1 Metalloendopeptidase [Aphelenchoides besseyi]